MGFNDWKLRTHDKASKVFIISSRKLPEEEPEDEKGIDLIPKQSWWKLK